MNAALKKEIIDSHRFGGSTIDALARHYGYPEHQIEKVIYPQGRGRKVLAPVIPKQRKIVHSGTLNGMPVAIGESVHNLRPVVNNGKPTSLSIATIQSVTPPTPVKMEKQDGRKKSPKAVIAALKAWNTMRKREADKQGVPFTPKRIPTVEELTGEQPPQQPIKTVHPPPEEEKILTAFNATPIVPPMPTTVAPQPTLKGTPKGVLGVGTWDEAVEASTDKQMWIDDPKTVYMGRVVEEYCRNNNITLKELLEAHRRILATIGMLCQPLKTLGG
jgi:hypothetical protein